MTKQLEDLLNLAPAEDDNGEKIAPEPDTEQAKAEIKQYQSALGTTQKIDVALPVVDDLEDNDIEMDELAAQAQEAYTDLMELGMNVDTKYAGRLFEVAGNMLGHAITAKNSKIDKKLRMVQLQLQKARLEQAQANKKVAAEDAEGQIVDRNELLRQLLAKNEEKA